MVLNDPVHLSGTHDSGQFAEVNDRRTTLFGLCADERGNILQAERRDVLGYAVLEDTEITAAAQDAARILEGLESP